MKQRINKIGKWIFVGGAVAIIGNLFTGITILTLMGIKLIPFTAPPIILYILALLALLLILVGALMVVCTEEW
ncbi:MAG: hypothetical protein JWP44_5035 [Mucilaginibacter sp.]|nr:hypothetical protein [Mucilaginibacter sp.]